MRIIIKLLFIITISSWSNLTAKEVSVLEPVNTDEFPKIEMKVNLSDPNQKPKEAFKLLEDGKEIGFEFSYAKDTVADEVTKTILFLIENLKHKDRKEFYQYVLLNTIEQVVSQGDKVKIAVFDRVRNQGKDAIKLLIEDYTDDVGILKNVIEEIEPVNDVFGKNNSSDLYHSIYEGLKELSTTNSENKILVVLSTAFNNKWSSHTSSESTKAFAKEQGIPIYSVQYRIQGYEHHKLTDVITETYGSEVVTNDKQEATNALMNFISNAVERIKGQNYRFVFTTSAPKNNSTHKIILSVNGKKHNLEFKTPGIDYWKDYPEYVIGAGVIAVLLLGFLIFLMVNARKKREKVEAARQKEIALANEKISMQEVEFEQMMEMNRRKEEEKQRRKEKEELIREMQLIGGYPRIHYFENGKKSTYEMSKPIITIGRNPDNDIIIQNPTVSRTHAKIYFRNGVYNIKDENSTSGILLNGRNITEYSLKHGDQLQLGESNLYFYL